MYLETLNHDNILYLFLQEKLAATTEALEGASRLSEQLDKKEEQMERMRLDGKFT